MQARSVQKLKFLRIFFVRSKNTKIRLLPHARTRPTSYCCTPHTPHFRRGGLKRYTQVRAYAQREPRGRHTPAHRANCLNSSSFFPSRVHPHTYICIQPRHSTGWFLMSKRPLSPPFPAADAGLVPSQRARGFRMFARRIVLFARLCTPGLTLAKASCSPLFFCELKSSVAFADDAAPSWHACQILGVRMYIH